MYDRSAISFRPLGENDLLLMFQWLRDPDVSRWYGRAPETLAEVEAKYLPRINGDDPVRCFIVSYRDDPVAYIQTYRIDHDTDYARALNVDRDAAGIDVFIGKLALRFQGFGAVMLREFVNQVVFADPDTSCCVIAPLATNTPAIRAYEKAGFRHIKTVPVPHEPEPEYIMILWPEDLETEYPQ